MDYPAKSAYKNGKVAEEYDKKRFHNIKGNLTDKREKKLVYKALKQAGIKQASKVLDVPCGTGRLSFFLAEKGLNVTGVDISSAMLNQCKEKLEHGRLKQQIEFLNGDAESLPFPDSSFDVSVSLRLFGHLPCDNRLNVLKELHRVSKSFVVAAYYHKNSLQSLRKRKGRARMGNSWNPVTLKQIDNELESANLRSVAKYFLLPGFSETVVVLAKKL